MDKRFFKAIQQNKVKILYLVLLFIYFFSSPSLSAQQIIYQGDHGIGHASLPNVLILVGNTKFEHQGILMYADSAHFNQALNNFDAFNNIIINVNDTLFIYGDVLHYEGSTRIATISGKVRMVDDSTVLVTDFLEYNRNTSIATYPNWGHTTDRDNNLYSKKGQYFSQTKDFHFRDSVVLQNPKNKILSDTLDYNSITEIAILTGPSHIYSKDNYIYTEKGTYYTKTDQAFLEKKSLVKNKEQTLIGDTIYYDKAIKYGWAKKHVEIIDTANNVIMQGHYAQVDEFKNYAYMTDSARVLFIDKDKGDTLYMHSDTIFGFTDSLQNFEHIHGFHHAKFFRFDLQGWCDSIHYAVKDSLVEMYYDPVIWIGTQQLSADTIRMLTGEAGLRKVFFQINAFIIAQSDTTQPEQFDQVKGKNMIGFFDEEGELDWVDVLGNSESIYYMWEEQPDKTQELIGVNVALGSDMRIHFEKRKPIRIGYYVQPDGIAYPIEELPEEKKKLKNFKWLYNERPKSKDEIFLRIKN